MKKVITAAFAITLVLLSAAFVANCSYSSNTPTAHNNTPPPPDSLKSNIPKQSPQRITTPKEIWKDETQYILSMLDDTTGLSKDNQFMLVKESSFHQGQQIKHYTQLYKEVEVYAGMVNLIFEQDTLFDKTEHLYKVSLDVNPSITEAEALAKLQSNETTPIKGKALQMKEGLIIKDAGSPFGKDEMHLCWIFHFSEYLVYVDAHSGQIVDCFSTTRY